MSDSAEDVAVVFVHGLWMTGLESFALRHHVVHGRGWSWRTFQYSSVGQSHTDVAAALDATVRSLSASSVHLVGHSLGGLIIQRALEQALGWPPGRVVFLGTPSLGSRAAEQLHALPFGDWLLGHSAELLLDSARRQWRFDRELGIVAGTYPVSVGKPLAQFAADEPNDGLVSVAETRLPGATAHLTLPVSHTGMLFSADVARQVCAFLATGRF
jgi:pimeloyl-ACP methyl ester carboxylesterase